MMLFYIWVIALLAALMLYFAQASSRFAKSGIRTMKTLPQLGQTAGLLTGFTHFVDIINYMYKVYPKDRFVGNIEFSKPVVTIRDTELIKKITVKDFEYFLDHRNIISEEIDPLFGRNLFSLKGQEWKDMRSTLSPAFTSSKMKHMLPFIVEVGNQMTSALKKELEESPTKAIDLDVKDLSTRYANDVIATCAFGLKVDSLSEPDNEFYKMGYKTSTFGFSVLLKFMGFASLPYIMKKLKITLFSEETRDFFKKIVVNTMKDRDEHKIIRPDMIHLLMEAKKGRLAHEESSEADVDAAGFATVEESSIGKERVDREWSDNDLIAQAILFFIAGFDTVSVAMSFLIYELAINPDVQERLFLEIMEHERQSGGKFEYNSIQSMPYMDMVVSESLRLWPPAVLTDRLCVKDYNLGRPNDESKADYIVKAGETLNIPIISIQRDPQYFPNPMKFDPDRFSEENKYDIKPFTYMPFGAGPRNCIGSRFALCEVKVMVYQLLRCVEVTPCERTTIPAKLAAGVNLKMKGGHWLRLRARS